MNVFSIDSKASIIPIRITNRVRDEQRTIDLLYVVQEFQSHYCLITKLASLCRSQVTTNIASSNFLCKRCLHFCQTQEFYRNHMELCNMHTPQKTCFLLRNDPKGKDKVHFSKPVGNFLFHFTSWLILKLFYSKTIPVLLILNFRLLRFLTSCSVRNRIKGMLYQPSFLQNSSHYHEGKRW